MHAEDLILDACRKGQPVEESIDARPRPHALGITQPLDAFYSEAEQSVDISGLCNSAPLFINAASMSKEWRVWKTCSLNKNNGALMSGNL